MTEHESHSGDTDLKERVSPIFDASQHIHPLKTIKTHDIQPVTMTPKTAPRSLIEIALDKGMGLDVIERLIALERDRERYEAEKAFNEGFAGFKSEVAVILKTRNVYFQSAKGVVDYDHAELADVLEVVGPLLSKYGFSWNWNVAQDRGWVRVTCNLRHRLGHCESVTMGAPEDETGSKNKIQAIGSSITYLERYTFKAVTGTAEKSQDLDGLPPPPPYEPPASPQHRNPTRSGVNASPAAQDSENQNPADFYPEATFKANLGPWRQAITSGRKTADQLIEFIESKPGVKPLTETQKSALRA